MSRGPWRASWRRPGTAGPRGSRPRFPAPIRRSPPFPDRWRRRPRRRRSRSHRAARRGRCRSRRRCWRASCPRRCGHTPTRSRAALSTRRPRASPTGSRAASRSGRASPSSSASWGRAALRPSRRLTCRWRRWRSATMPARGRCSPGRASARSPSSVGSSRGAAMRVLLINPPSPEQLGSPLLGLEYVAASLLARGCEVRVIDAAARHFPHDAEWILREAESFAPRIIGFSLFTRWVWHAYALAEQLCGGPWLLVAGGAHTTVCPEETLQRGFDVAFTGEAEQSLVRVVDWLEGRDDLGCIPGAVFRRPGGGIGAGPPAQFIEQLDALAPPYLAQKLFDPRWYDPSGRETAPGGILTSRGCPARCTFCANNVTGRSFRYRSAENVTEEINAWHERYGLAYFPCWDDALTANSSRLMELCAAIERDVRFPFAFGAITRANMVTRDML